MTTAESPPSRSAPHFDSSGFTQFRPQERVSFEYRIDRKPRLLERRYMFANPFHPSGAAIEPDFFVCNSLHAHNLRTGLVYLGPGGAHDFPPYPNEHFVLQVTGSALWELDGARHAAATGAEMFVPAFMPYRLSNPTDAEAWVLSSYLRIDDWYGLAQEQTQVAAGCEQPRFLGPEPVTVAAGEWHATARLTASRNSSRLLDFGPGAETAPTHSRDEQVIFGVSGRTRWHVDGTDYPVGSGDLLFIPAMTPFSGSAAEASRAAVFDVRLG